MELIRSEDLFVHGLRLVRPVYVQSDHAPRVCRPGVEICRRWPHGCCNSELSLPKLCEGGADRTERQENSVKI